jgi:hypothetical protein
LSDRSRRVRCPHQVGHEETYIVSRTPDKVLLFKYRADSWVMDDIPIKPGGK